jgi:hypothetical protein
MSLLAAPSPDPSLAPQHCSKSFSEITGLVITVSISSELLKSFSLGCILCCGFLRKPLALVFSNQLEILVDFNPLREKKEVGREK